MYNYSYTAINEKGRKIRGEVMAENELDLETRLKELGLDLVTWREVKEKKHASFLSRVKIKDMIIFCLHMEQLDRAGVPINDALADARDAAENPKLKDVLTSVFESVKGGTILSESMAQHPNVFNDVFVGLIAAGEKTGNLSESFHNLANHLKWTNDLKRKVRKAMSYPIVLFVVLTGVITMLMMYVVPQLVDFIVNQGFEIPLHTQLLIDFSEFFGKYWYGFVIVPPVVFVTVGIMYRVSEPFAYFIDGLILRVPIIGPTMRKISLARFSHFFAVMFRSGIDILDALLAGREVAGNRVIKEAVSTVHRSVTEGNKLTESIRMSNQFPNLVVRMFKVGEDSGNLNSALENINFFYDREVNDAVDGLVAMIQPVMMIVMGSLIFWIIAAVFGPLYDSFSKMDF